MSENNNIFANSIQKDEELDVTKLLNKAQNSATKSEPVQEQQQSNPSPIQDVKQQPEIKGLIIKNSDLIDSSGPKLNMMESEERQKDFDDTVKEQEALIEKREMVKVVKNTSTPGEYIQMLEEIDSVKVVDGKPVIDLKDENGNPVEPEFIKLRDDENDDSFDMEKITGVPDEEVTSSQDEEDTAEKKEIISVIIDKTGLGTDFIFTEEEKEKIVKSDVIEVKEVKVLDLDVNNIKKTSKSFSEVLKEYDYSGPKTLMTFPNSGYKAEIKGMGTGEYADITMSVPVKDGETETVDGFNKKLTVLYNKMVNVSSGPFKDFDDFASKTAWVDIQFGIYGLYLSSEKEEQVERFECMNPRCRTEHDVTFNTHSLLKLDKTPLSVLENIKEIATAPSIKYSQLKKNSPVETSKIIVMPDSKFKVELGMLSAKEYMENYLPLLDSDIVESLEDQYSAEFVEGARDLLLGVRKIYIPTKDGKDYVCDEFDTIIGALYKLPFKDYKLVEAYVIKQLSNVSVTFEIDDVCPHCGTKNSIPILPEQLVFLKFHHTGNMSIDLKNITEV